MRTTVSALSLSAVLMTGSVHAQTSTPMPTLTVGEPFADVVLPSLVDGSPMALSQFRGQKVILHIFASW